MPDYGQTLEFGVFPTPNAAGIPGLQELVALAEVSGLEHVSIQDHPYQARHLDTWTLLSYLGARTSTIKLSTNVANLPLRPPVVLAKSAATLDLLTGGRVELGLGSGAFWDAIVAAGAHRKTPGEAVSALAEALQIIRAFWAGGAVKVEGDFYQVSGLKAGPRPAHEIPIWLGAYKPRMLGLTGRLADGWVPSMGYADPPALPALNETIDAAALKAGRPPAAVKRVYNIFGRFGTGSDFLTGTPADWAEQLAELTLSTGMSTYILGTDDPGMLRTFAEDVVPAVRDAVDAGRAGAASGPDAPPAAAPPATRVSDVPRVAVVPTPDTAKRFSEDEAWADWTRPTTHPDPDATFTAQQAAAPQHLIEIHDSLRAELAQVRDLIGQVREGHINVGRARSAIHEMSMRQNNWTLGAYCESYCRIVAGHHTLEDRSIFAHLRRSEPALAPVLDRLVDEHHVIHDLLDELDRALIALVSGEEERAAASLANLQEVVDLFTDALLSHLAYEERELIAPLARHGLY